LKLVSENSYQRSIGLMLIAENVQWDTYDRTDSLIDEYLTLTRDEKPITVRQCIQSLGKIVQYKPYLSEKIVERLISMDLGSIKETMRKSILLDILNVLAIIKEFYGSEAMEHFIINALSGEILDKKSKRQMEMVLLS
jgi:hypothetical protein